MSSKLRGRLTFANVMSLLALFVALGGSSYAAIALERKSVKSKHIAKKAVKKRHVAKGAVTSGKVRNESLLAKDFAPGQLPAGEKGDKGERGEQGLPGLQGAQGPPGPQGEPGDTNLQVGAASETATTPQRLLTWSDLGIAVETDGDADHDETVFVRNISPPGGENLWRFTYSSFSLVAPGSVVTGSTYDIGTGRRLFRVGVGDDLTPGVVVECVFESSGLAPVICHGSQAG